MGRGPEDAETTAARRLPLRRRRRRPVVRFQVAGGRAGDADRGVGGDPARAQARAPRPRSPARSSRRSSPCPPTSTTPSGRPPRTPGGSRGSRCCACSTSRPRRRWPTGSTRAARGTFAVYDLGGGTFDISILKLDGRRVRGEVHRRRLARSAATTSTARIAERLLAAHGRARAPDAGRRSRRAARRRARGEGGAHRREEATSSSSALGEDRAPSPAPSCEALDRAARSSGPASPCRRALKDAGVDAAASSTASSWSAARPACRPCARFVAELFGQRAARRHRSRPGRRAGRGGAGRPARRRASRAGRGAAARRHPALARARDDGRRGREAHPAQHDDPHRRDADVHHLRRQPDAASTCTWCRASASWRTTAARWRASR